MKTLSALCLTLVVGYLAHAVTVSAAEAPRPLAPPTALSLQEARVIIDTAVAYAREQKLTMTVVVLDEVDMADSPFSSDGQMPTAATPTA